MSDNIINGDAYDFGQITVKVGTKTYSLIKGIDYETKQDRGKIRGTSPGVRRFTRGTKDESGSITWLKDGPDGFDAFVKDQGPGFGEVELTILVQYGNNGQPVTTDTLKGCKLGGVKNGHKEGNEGLEVTTGLDVKHIDYGGNPFLNPNY
jgi:hypothetical protein